MKCDVAAIPKAEMHIHLEGAIRRDTYAELRKRDDPSFSWSLVPWYDDDYRFHDLGHFLDTAFVPVIRGLEDYKRIASELFEDLVAQNVIYAEVSLASSRIPIDEIADVVGSAKHDVCADSQLQVGILVGLFRSKSPEFAIRCVEKAAASKRFGVVGVDLLDHETACKAADFTEAFSLARAEGLGLRAHAGEGAGPESVWDAILSLNVSRVAHGVRAIEDPKLVDYMREAGITLDLCPTSNARVSIVDSIYAHPVRRFFDMGLKVTVSSDDPLIFNSDITSELELLQNVFGFTPAELLQLTKNAIDGAFLPPEKKRSVKKRLEKFLEKKGRC